MTIKFSGGVAATGPIKAEVNIAPVWVTSPGTIGSQDELTVVSFQFDATDPEGGSLTFSVFSGSLPAGLNLSNSGLLSGTASDVVSDTTSGFTLRVTDEGGLFQDRTFSIEITDFIIIPNMWSWGNNISGQLGHGNIIYRSSPVAIGSSQTWTKIGIGQDTTLAIEEDGTLWSWGFGGSGRLGHGDTITRSSPVQVGSLTDWSNAVIDISRIGAAVAIKPNNTMWVWGRNYSGELGLGDTTFRSSPVQVGGDTIWSSVSTGESHMIAIRTDGTLWAWGSDSAGQLGLGASAILRSSPVQVGSLTNWAKITCGGNYNLALKTDGTLWSWGSGRNGGLGHGDTTFRSSPVQIGNLSNWVSITDYPSYSGTHAINSLGELWAWGLNNHGKLGDGTTIAKSSPIQIGSDTNWSIVAGGANGPRSGIKTDGTLWAWGINSLGSLGLGDTISRSSPVQIGGLTDWTDVKIGGRHTLALRNTL